MNTSTIAIFGVPRSGTSWIGQLFNSAPSVAYRFQPLFSHAFKHRLTITSTRNETDLFFRDLLMTQDDFVLQRKNISGNEIASFVKQEVSQQLVFKEVRYLNLIEPVFIPQSDCKFVFIIRNPLAVIHSWINAPKEYKPEWKLEDEWKEAPSKNQDRPEEYFGYNKWKEAALLFHKLRNNFPNRVHILHYEEFVSNAEDKLPQLFHFCGIKMNEQTLNFLRESQSRDDSDAYGVHRKKQNIHKWQDSLPAYVVNAVKEDLKGTDLNKYI